MRQILVQVTLCVVLLSLSLVARADQDPVRIACGTKEERLLAVLPGGCRIAGDLNDDGIPELICRGETDFRANYEVHETLLVCDSRTKEYAASGIFAYSWHDANCAGEDEPKESLTIDETATPLPAIVLERKVVRVAKGCENREEIKSDVIRYQWSPVFQTYVTSLAVLGNGSFSSLGPIGRQAHRLVLSRNGSVKELKNDFTLDTKLSGFALKNGTLYFTARDTEWETAYAWQVARGKLHFKARNRTTGKVVYSKPYADNPFWR